MPSATRRLAAIMFTDMVGYTALMQQNEVLAIQKRDRSKKIFEEVLAKHDGRLLQYYGDGTMSLFSSGVNAVRAAVEMQTQFLSEPRIDVRIGIHTGDVMTDENGIYGDSVNVASRIESLAVPGGVFISEKLFDEVKNIEGITARALGFFELKNVKQPMQVYAITNPGLVIPARDELKGKTKTTLNGIAVLPFASLSSDPENEFFCDGITEELINVLAQVDGLQVTSRTSAFAFKGRNEDVREIAAKLNVQKVIEGSVRKAGNKARITAQLINAADGYHFWSATYDRQLEDIFDVQDEIARAIANKLRANLTEEKHTSEIAEAPTQNLEAYKKYLKGAYDWDNIDPQVKSQAIQLLHEAVEMDPDFANAHAVLANIYSFPGLVPGVTPQESKRRFVHHAQEAVRAQPRNPKALTAMAMLRLHQWDWPGSYDLLQQAVAINPSEPLTYFWLSEYHNLMLQFDQAKEMAQRMADVDPMNPRTLAEAGRALLGQADTALSRSFLNRSLQLNPQNFLAKQMLAYVAMSEKKYDEALEIMTANHRLAGDHPYVLLGLLFVYYAIKSEEKLKEILGKFEQFYAASPDPETGLLLSIACLINGDEDRFQTLYDAAIAARSLFALQFYGGFANLDVFNNDYIRLTRIRLGLPG
jgi:TolB-like protein/cytochrome c-type biogenesis protein CcmH/NrfG